MAIKNRNILRVEFNGGSGHRLAARLDMPTGQVRGFALFAHCFTCSKDLFAPSRISAELARLGLAVLRFDFTGLGQSDGEFGNTNFSSNVDDIVAAAAFLREHYAAPRVLIGHSLGGTAVLCAASRIAEVEAVATLGAPADAEHVTHQFGASIEDIERDGRAAVTLAGRQFEIARTFLDDVREQNVRDHIRNIDAALLVMHSPQDTTVGVDNARKIFDAARHPKSFVSLDGADHLITGARDAVYAARVISAWASRRLSLEPAAEEHEATGVRVVESGQGKFQQLVTAGPHRLLADEPTDVGGLGSGPTPYEFIAVGLAACTSMTLRLYAEHKGLDLGRIDVSVSHDKVHARDVDRTGGKIDVFERVVSVEGGVDDALEAKLLEIADKCPVHRTLEGGAVVRTRIEPALTEL